MKKSRSREPFVRVGTGSAELIIKNKIKGRYYYVDESLEYVTIDNLSGKMKIARYKSLDELLKQVC